MEIVVKNKEVIKMGLDIKQSEGKKRFDEEFDKHMEDIVVKKGKLDLEG